jgi:hypothetical protein
MDLDTSDNSMTDSLNATIKDEFDEDEKAILKDFQRFDQSNLASSSKLRLQVRGARPGTGAGAKRKAEDAYSENPHTQRSRARVERMNEAEKTVDRAKKAESQAIRRALKPIRESAPYQQSTPEEREELLAQMTCKVKQRRCVKYSF